MKAMLIEDERMAREQLASVIRDNFPDIGIVKMTDSVEDSIAYLREEPQPDVIFMDVELLDGNAFDIFREVDVRSAVIMTTAYDSYAIKAFETGSIDYLLKPISLDRLRKAVSRCRGNCGYRKLLTVRCGNSIIPVATEEAVCFYSENKANYVLTSTGERYLVDFTMEQLEVELDPSMFIRISRSCIVSRRFIVKAVKDSSGHMEVIVKPEAPIEMTVSRSRIDCFLKWMENLRK